MDNGSIFIIFGITGDLAKRKLLPALYHLVQADAVPEVFHILGITRRQTTVVDVMNGIRDVVGEGADETTITRMADMITMVNMDIGKTSDYDLLRQAITDVESHAGRSLHRLHYLAVPPEMFGRITDSLGEYGLSEQPDDAQNRVLIEKPFGHDTASAMELIEQMNRHFNEASIYRVDHYLAKETAQNILTFRFNNPLFHNIWDNASVDHILITAAETIGIEDRVNFYENVGALRDLIQSHLLQLLALVAMEEPMERSAEHIHASRLAVLNSIKPVEPEDAVRGQYNSYREETGNYDTKTETYAAIKLEIDNPRWRGVPILLRTGKGLAEKETDITLIYTSREPGSTDKNALTMRIQPNEGIIISLLAKRPGLEIETENVRMEFTYEQAFNAKQPDAYERVIADAIRGDKTLFTTDQEVLAAWRIIEKLIQDWEHSDSSPEIYEAGSWGPTCGDALADSIGAVWLNADFVAASDDQ
jgi:glucose-6-phosphate 1-dehydrogenase